MVLMEFKTHYPQMAPWHIEYFKGVWENGWYREVVLTSPTCLSLSPETGWKTLIWKFSCTEWNENPTLQRQRDAKKNPDKQALLSFPICYTYLALLNLSHSSMIALLSKLSIKPSALFFWVSFPYEVSLPCHIKLILHIFVCLWETRCTLLFQESCHKGQWGYKMRVEWNLSNTN